MGIIKHLFLVNGVLEIPLQLMKLLEVELGNGK